MYQNKYFSKSKFFIFWSTWKLIYSDISDSSKIKYALLSWIWCKINISRYISITRLDCYNFSNIKILLRLPFTLARWTSANIQMTFHSGFASNEKTLYFSNIKQFLSLVLLYTITNYISRKPKKLNLLEFRSWKGRFLIHSLRRKTISPSNQ